MSKTRFETFRIDSAERTPQGALKVQAYVTKTGIFPYETPAGKVVRENRSAEEVFKEDSIESLIGAPVTVFHPRNFISVDSWKALAVGSVVSAEVADPYISATLVIYDAHTISQIEDGELSEISCGYASDVEPAASSDPFEFVQTSIRYNHASLLPEGHGRLGSDVGLRLDSKNNLIVPEDIMTTDKETLEVTDAEPTQEVTDEEAAAASGEPADAPAETTEDAPEEEAPAEEEEAEEAPAEEEEAPAEEEEAPAEEEEEEPDEVTLDSLNGKLDALLEMLSPKEDAEPEEEAPEEEAPAEEGEPEEKTDALTEEQRIDSLVEERVSFKLRVREAHKALLTDSSVKDKTDRDLCLEGLKVIDSDFDGSSYEDSALLGMLELAAKTTTGKSLSEKLRPAPQVTNGHSNRLDKILRGSK